MMIVPGALGARPIKLVVPLAAGSTADIVSRFAGEQLAKLVGQPVVIDNKPAAGCTVLLYEQTCAAEKRRRRKKGRLPDPEQRLLIHRATAS